jgi:hypothetical protein
VRGRSWVATAAALAPALSPLAARALIIDTFESGQFVASSVGPVCCFVEPGLSEVAAPAGSIGVTRVLTARGEARIANVQTGIGGGAFGLALLAAPDHGRGSVTWDVAAPIDLTEGGRSTAFAFDVQTMAETLWIDVSAGSQFSELSTSVPGRHYEVPFSAFDPAILASATEIALLLDASPSAPGGISIGGPFQTVPEPAAALFALALLAPGARSEVTRL